MDFCSKAVVVKAFGSYNCLSIQKVPLCPLDGKVEVEVFFCGMNFADVYVRQGLMPDRKLPTVLGIECAGIIRAIGNIENCSLLVGQRVICYDYNGGLFQDIIRISPKNCYPLPDDITLEVGAAIFVNYLTAYFVLFDLGCLKPSHKVLIQSCAGGVGFAATQLAKTVDAEIIGTASSSKLEAVTLNGVNRLINYENLQEEIITNYPEGIDLIIDNQAGSNFCSLQNLLKPLGKIIIIGTNSVIVNDKRLSWIGVFKAWWNMKAIEPYSLVANNRMVGGFHLGILAEKEPGRIHDVLDQIFQMLREGKITPKVHRVLPIDDVVNATKLLGERSNVGKVLLSIPK